jgi:hypothetical protein
MECAHRLMSSDFFLKMPHCLEWIPFFKKGCKHESLFLIYSLSELGLGKRDPFVINENQVTAKAFSQMV